MFLLSFLIIIILAIYFYVTRNYQYWSKRNVKHDPPIPFFGNHYRNFFGYSSITSITIKLCNKYYNEKVIGYYRWTDPELIVNDPDIIKRILNKDFEYFHVRGVGRNPDVEPLFSINLFHSDGDIWKLLRKRLTPAFTSAKLKGMFPLIVKYTEKLQVVSEDIASRGGECDVRELVARFFTEFIGACGFGIEMNAINNEISHYREFGKLMFRRTLKDALRFTLWELFPILRSKLYVFDRKIEETMMHIIKNVLTLRNDKPCGRNDFIDLLLELREKGKMIGESIEKRNPDGTPMQVEMEMDFKCIAAQAFLFFGAGFETSSFTTSYTLHELAFNPDIQYRIQEKIDQVLLKFDNKLCYDAISEMSLLSMAFKEGMRIFPSLGILTRTCVKPYTIPEVNMTIDPGVKIIIPVHAIQNDNKYYDKPEQFRPERFTPEAEAARHNCVYLPFGDGPRGCIGSRLGHMQSVAVLAAILHKFTVEPSSRTTRRFVPDPRSNIIQAVKEMPLLLRRRHLQVS